MKVLLHDYGISFKNNRPSSTALYQWLIKGVDSCDRYANHGDLKTVTIALKVVMDERGVKSDDRHDHYELYHLLLDDFPEDDDEDFLNLNHTSPLPTGTRVRVEYGRSSFFGIVHKLDQNRNYSVRGIGENAAYFLSGVTPSRISAIPDDEGPAPKPPQQQDPGLKFNNETIRVAVKEYMKGVRNAEKQYGKIRLWDVSEVTDMSYLFVLPPNGYNESYKFNPDLKKWDTSNVTTMKGMFHQNHLFSGNVSSWCVERVEDFSVMFYKASAFNGDLRKWEVESATVNTGMFYSCPFFDMSKSPDWTRDWTRRRSERY
ncbi:hypothetical protein TL16_g06507 [Triparma laevis f. inornata]|uniref:Uncharacterized protein n=1 Tax=Triparma laevis f. inornata TaxID=1714386 RepID=A0A9W7ASA7_9STRA|nr:hypothetical protein TL16_g06507 [Triparma laevis f. inornata]